MSKPFWIKDVKSSNAVMSKVSKKSGERFWEILVCVSPVLILLVIAAIVYFVYHSK